jgi:hypothetical protein
MDTISYSGSRLFAYTYRSERASLSLHKATCIPFALMIHAASTLAGTSPLQYQSQYMGEEGESWEAFSLFLVIHSKRAPLPVQTCEE